MSKSKKSTVTGMISELFEEKRKFIREEHMKKLVLPQILPGTTPTLKQRLALILVICSLLSVILMITVSYLAMQAAEKTRIETILAGDIKQLSEQIDSEYTELLQISQQMIPPSIVGGMIQSYIQATDHYDRIAHLNNMTATIAALRFTHSDSSLVLCFEPNEGEGDIRSSYYNNLAVRNGFSLNKHPILRRTGIEESGFLTFYAMHTSDCVIYCKDTVSVSRIVKMKDGHSMAIYLELFSKVPLMLETLTELRDMPYFWLQIDPDGVIQYSSHEAFPVGSSFPAQEGDGVGNSVYMLDEYSYMRSESKYGFHNILLVPKSNYNKAMQFWRGGVLMVLVAAIVFIFFTIAMIFYLIFRPMNILRQEIAQVTEGDFTQSKHNIRLQEFDQLFDSINVMKIQIQELLVTERRQEKEKMQLELDKLYYQINPHFLMNALNTVHWMAVTNHQPGIKRFVHQLNYILGYSLGKTNCNATLFTEVMALKAYVELQLCRYDFKVWYDIDEGPYLQTPCARLILQPIAENAVCHNMNHLGNLWVSVHHEENHAEVVIRDDGLGFSVDSARISEDRGLKRGIGLKYVELILQSFYGGRAELQVESAPENGTKVTIRIPLREDTGGENVPGSDY